MSSLAARRGARGPTEIHLPVLHPGQAALYRTRDPATGKRARFIAGRCGRRWGKTDLGKTVAADRAVKGKKVGWFAPDYKIQTEAYNEILDVVEPVLQSKNRMEGVIRTRTGGRIDFWTLENDRAGRSRSYDLVIIDEAAFTKPNAIDVWDKSIKPTLLDRLGSAIVLSNTNGDDPDNFFWKLCNEPKWGFVSYHAPTRQNPFMPAAEIDKLKADSHPLVFAQEYEAEFVDWSGVAFFAQDKLLEDGVAVPFPAVCDAVYAVIDTANKTGTENDGTGVVYWAVTRFGEKKGLVVLDWDVVQIEGAMLETWLPTVFQNLDALAVKCRARSGPVGAWIEDKTSGTILLQQAARRGWPAHAIESKLTALGKDERAISVSGYVHRGEVKFSAEAYDRVTTYKNATRNHLLAQVLGFRVADKKAATRQDDLLDCFTYGIAIGLGDARGF